MKKAVGYDDALDVFGVHCIGGITGALATGILVNPELGGIGITDYTNLTDYTGVYNLVAQLKAQGIAVAATLIWSGVGSAIIYKLVDLIIGLRPPLIKSAKAWILLIMANALIITKIKDNN